MDSTWLLTKEAAAYLGMHPDTARDLMRRGDIRAVKKGKAWRTTKRWCDDYLTEGAA
ncbi:TPA: helix-turn-helix domain-containing protein [Corynebacterium striatum]|nr:helix-turn-helix domain-containing protein [Corynebacterium striatum]